MTTETPKAPDWQAVAGRRIREEREKSRLTQREVSALVGFDFSTISAHENGRGITDEAIKKYAKLFKVDSHTLVIDIDVGS